MNYTHFTIKSRNAAIMDELQKYLVRKDLMEEDTWENRAEISASIPDRYSECVVEKLKLLSAIHQGEKIEAEISFEHDWHCKTHFVDFVKGEDKPTGIRYQYQFRPPFRQDKAVQSKIETALIGYFEKVDEIPQEPEELIVTIMIDDYKVTAKKIDFMVDIINVQKKVLCDTWESVEVEPDMLIDDLPF
jgi:hypothetical protein